MIYLYMYMEKYFGGQCSWPRVKGHAASKVVKIFNLSPLWSKDHELNDYKTRWVYRYTP